MTDYIFTTSTGEDIPVVINVRRGLRCITLRPKINPRREICISKPWLTSMSSAIKFLEQKTSWVDRFFISAPAKTSISNGDVIEFLGMRVRILQNSLQKSNGYQMGQPDGGDYDRVLVIGGAPDMLESRIRDFIKKEFLTEIKRIIKTAPSEFWPSKIAVRDTTTRWGSCSSTGTVSFSWRLALAPYDVMRYVVMHELAHKKHMDHSAAFWAQVSNLYGFGVVRAKRWLSAHGNELHKNF